MCLNAQPSANFSSPRFARLQSTDLRRWLERGNLPKAPKPNESGLRLRQISLRRVSPDCKALTLEGGLKGEFAEGAQTK
jgi:hypothetical protein